MSLWSGCGGSVGLFGRQEPLKIFTHSEPSVDLGAKTELSKLACTVSRCTEDKPCRAARFRSTSAAALASDVEYFRGLPRFRFVGTFSELVSIT